MKARTKILISAAIIGVIAISMALLGHKKVHAELVIPASAAEIWEVLTDAAQYKDWNPVFVDVQGEYREGAKLTYQMKNQDGKQSEVVSTVIKLVPEKELNQFGGIRGIVTFDHRWTLEPVAGGTRVVQHEEYRGLYVWFWDPSWFEAAYARANEALRDRVAPLR